jgi:hypothetical protein
MDKIGNAWSRVDFSSKESSFVKSPGAGWTAKASRNEALCKDKAVFGVGERTIA